MTGNMHLGVINVKAFQKVHGKLKLKNKSILVQNGNEIYEHFFHNIPPFLNFWNTLHIAKKATTLDNLTK